MTIYLKQILSNPPPVHLSTIVCYEAALCTYHGHVHIDMVPTSILQTQLRPLQQLPPSAAQNPHPVAGALHMCHGSGQ